MRFNAIIARGVTRGVALLASLAACSASPGPGPQARPAETPPGPVDAAVATSGTGGTPGGFDAAEPDAGTQDAPGDTPVALRPDARRDAYVLGDLGPLGIVPISPDRDYTADRRLFFGDSRCTNAKVQLCEDFEQGTLDPQRWRVNGEMPTIEGIRAARGSKALHISVTGNKWSRIRESMTFPAINNTYFGRAFFYFQTLNPAPKGGAHFDLVSGNGTGATGEIRVSGQHLSGKNLLTVGTFSQYVGGTGDWLFADKDPGGMPRPFPVGEWICLEWMHKGDTHETRTWWDGVEHPSLYTTATRHGGSSLTPYVLPKFTSVTIGWIDWMPNTDLHDVWIDEIAIDSQRIGCVL